MAKKVSTKTKTDSIISFVVIYTESDTGAYSPNSPTLVSLIQADTKDDDPYKEISDFLSNIPDYCLERVLAFKGPPQDLTVTRPSVSINGEAIDMNPNAIHVLYQADMES